MFRFISIAELSGPQAHRRAVIPVRLECLERRLCFSAGSSAAIHPFVAQTFPDLQITFNGQTIVPGGTTTSSTNGTDFGGATQGGAPVVHTFTVTNTGSAEYVVSDAVLQSLEFSHAVFAGASSSQVDLQPGQSGNFAVSMLTTSPGFVSDTIFLSYSGVNSANPIAFPVSGYVAPASAVSMGTLSSTPATDNSSVSVGQANDSNGNHPSNPQERTLSFHLNSPSTVTFNVAATLDAASQGTGDMQLLLTRDANGNGILDESEINQPTVTKVITSGSGQQTVTAPNLAAGDWFVNLSVANFSTTQQNGTVARVAVNYQLSMSAAASGSPGIAVSFGSVAIPDNQAAPSTAAGTDYGSTPAGQAGPDHAYTVANTGTAPLTLGAVNVPSGFEVSEGLPASLAPGASTMFSVHLISATAGAESGSISFSDNAAGSNPFSFAVQGVVTSPTPTPTPTPVGTPTPTPPLTDTQKVAADAAQIVADKSTYTQAIAADNAALKATVAADKAAVNADKARVKADRHTPDLLVIDKAQLAADTVKLHADTAAGKAKVKLDKAGEAAQLRADKAQLKADQRQLKKDKKAGLPI